ncbi:GATA zinc finger domain-containing protein [Mycena sanguinolenta]|uniref:GATA zinc finger domain-containing protein n=1 Tax=Mycena sanguinolenta TaxID=230812 RepID=A0A8H6XUJ4_9AGAR|nr:GATA zinc finger domain-containing protein [Mycena sanguinolenta]
MTTVFLRLKVDGQAVAIIRFRSTHPHLMSLCPIQLALPPTTGVGPNHPTPPLISLGLSQCTPEPESPEMDSRGQLLELSYSNDWPTSNIAQYATFQRNKSALWHSSSDGSQSWSPSLPGGSSMSPSYNEYAPSSPYSSATSSSSSSPSYFLNQSTTSGMLPPTASPPRRRGASNDQGAPKKSCFHCHVTSTPLWRREPSTQRPLCNACGLYLQQRNKLRPQELIDADIDDDDTPQIPDEEYTGPKCSHCLTRQTSVWRRSKTGAQVCNACGVYQRLRGKERPLSLRRNKIKPHQELEQQQLSPAFVSVKVWHRIAPALVLERRRANHSTVRVNVNLRAGGDNGVKEWVYWQTQSTIDIGRVSLVPSS